MTMLNKASGTAFRVEKFPCLIELQKRNFKMAKKKQEMAGEGDYFGIPIETIFWLLDRFLENMIG